MNASPVLIVALDVPSLAAAADLVARVRGVTPWFKVGSMLFTRAGPEAVRMVQAAGGRVFLDLKFHDIPQTVSGAVRAAVDLGAALITVHCAAGAAALEAAALAARPAGGAAQVLGVTRLTSEPGRVAAGVLRSATLAREAGLDGVTASARDCPSIKRRFGREFQVLTPGIRPAGTAADDQVRVATPSDAVRAGSNYLVVGRPIIAAPDPGAAAATIAADMAAAHAASGASSGP